MTSSREAPSPKEPLFVSVPCTGDFVVMRLNPQLSVMHLDSLAKEEAAAMRPRPYFALTLRAHGLVGITKGTHEFELLLVRDTRRPPPDHIDEKFRIPSDIASRLAIPISNIPLRQNDNKDQVLNMPNFPRSGCVIEFVYGRHCVRVTTARRDFTKAVTMSIPESSHLRHLNRCAGAVRESLVKAGDIPTGFNPRGDADVMTRQFLPPECIDDGESSSNVLGSSEHGSLRQDQYLSDIDYMFLKILEPSGSLNVPVVDVYYDLSTVEDIGDPREFLSEQWELYEIVKRATHRMFPGAHNGSRKKLLEPAPKRQLATRASIDLPKTLQVRHSTDCERPDSSLVRDETYASVVRRMALTDQQAPRGWPRSSQITSAWGRAADSRN